MVFKLSVRGRAMICGSTRNPGDTPIPINYNAVLIQSQGLILLLLVRKASQGSIIEGWPLVAKIIERYEGDECFLTSVNVLSA